MRATKVLKFGGTSMGSAKAMEKTMAVIRKPQRDVRIGAVVVSAMGGVTDDLINIAMLAAASDSSYKTVLAGLERRHLEAAKRLVSRRNRTRSLANIRTLLGHLEDVVRGISLVHELSPRALDYIMSYGERLSAHLLTEALLDRGVQCEYLNARSVITTDGTFGSASVDFKATNPAIRAHFKKHKKLQIVTGFIAADRNGVTTTLGRGGSDYTASILGAAIGARAIEIWTDVSGVMTADPRKVKDALAIPAMTYQEAVEMSYFGAKVIHPPTMQPALEKGIPILIKNTFEPDAPGTVISEQPGADDGLARGISSVSGAVLLQISGSGMVGVRGAAGRLFSALSRRSINVILITQASSQHSISIAIAPRDTDTACAAIEEEFALERAARRMDPVTVKRDLSIIAVVGERLRHQRGVAGRLFQALGDNGVNIVAIAQGSSELNISVVVSKADEARTLRAVHAALFSPHSAFISIFLVGTGLIGSTVLRQIAAQKDRLAGGYGYELRVVAVADAEKMHFDSEGIAPAKWRAALSASRKKMNVGTFIDEMIKLNVPNSVFVDCTASTEVAGAYAEILSAGISIVTPNKKANSGALSYYRRLKGLAARDRAAFLYETNVGAGLPVLSTLNDLLISGDRVVRIEAVLSGTLSYIFNTFEGDKKFSEVVREAKQLGYTEPDPRDDLGGVDVGRKILILGREIGLPLELKDVKVESLLSKKAAAAKSVEGFFTQLEKEDAAFEKKKQAAQRAGMRLRYIAILEKGKARVSLRAVPDRHPFYQLSGSDNIISFTTARYKDTPLVVKGPGAGAEVTAAGVFADILRTAHRRV